MKSLLLASLLLCAANAFAGAADLVGKWQASCLQADASGKLFAKTISEFFANGAFSAADHFYADSQCASAVLYREEGFNGNYKATDRSFQITGIQNDRTLNLTADYTVIGDRLTFTMTSVIFDGKPTEFRRDPAELTRVK